MTTNEILEFTNQICRKSDCSVCPFAVQDYENNDICAWSTIEKFLNLITNEEERRKKS